MAGNQPKWLIVHAIVRSRFDFSFVSKKIFTFWEHFSGSSVLHSKTVWDLLQIASDMSTKNTSAELRDCSVAQVTAGLEFPVVLFRKLGGM